jgi:hypothetical protein
MVPALATIVAVYAAARLLHAPIAFEPPPGSQAVEWRRLTLGVISVLALVVIFIQWDAIQRAARNDPDPAIDRVFKSMFG